jgi:hypothetical protein
MDESACAQGSNKGALVFYHYEGKWSPPMHLGDLHSLPQQSPPRQLLSLLLTAQRRLVLNMHACCHCCCC